MESAQTVLTSSPLKRRQVPHMGRHSGGHARSHLPTLWKHDSCSIAEGAASRKNNKYSAIAQSYAFVPLAVETLGSINFKGLKFLSELGDRLISATDDLRDLSFPIKRISILIQRFNSVCFQGLSSNLRRSNFSHSRNCF